jgi:hypothetical protein
MPLSHLDIAPIREPRGFTFYMEVRKTKQDLRVFVPDEVLTGGDDTLAVDLQKQFEMERAELEAMAWEKYNHGRVSADGIIIIALSDIAGMIS